MWRLINGHFLPCRPIQHHVNDMGTSPD
jgi:hypothetical protein